MTTRRTSTVKGRQGTDVTVVVETYRGKVWLVSVDPPFSVEAIMEPVQAENLGELLARAAKDARGTAKLRREALCRIPDAVGKNSEERS